MPAITTQDTPSLPRVERVDATSTKFRRVKTLTSAPKALEGEGFPVYRAFAGVSLAELDPFVHMDQMGEVQYAPGEPKGTPWHPHRGFETVTYMIDGTFDHKDSNGGGGRITNGDTQWMTAGSGILHIEAPPESLVVSGGLFHGIQLWVNLPAVAKFTAPRYQDIRAEQEVLLTTEDGGSLLRVIAGQVGAHVGPGTTFTPITMLHASISPGAKLEMAWPAKFNALVYVLAGKGTIAQERVAIGPSQLGVLGAGEAITISGDTHQDSRTSFMEVLLLGGLPINEPVVHYGPFVMSTRAEIAQAMQDYQQGRLGQIPS